MSEANKPVALRDGKICQVNKYFCTRLADEVIWPLIAGFRPAEQPAHRGPMPARYPVNIALISSIRTEKRKIVDP